MLSLIKFQCLSTKSISFCLLLSIMIFSSCEEIIDVEIQSFEAALIIEGGIVHQIDGSTDLQTIRVTETVDFLEQNGAKPITNAQIEVFDGDNTFVFAHLEDGNYTANIPTEIGRTYQVKIDYNGQVFEGEELLGNVTAIDSLYTSFEEETTFTDAGYFAKINTRDEPNVANWYHWRIFVDDMLTVIPDPGNQANLIATDDFFDGQAITGYKPNEEIVLEIGQTVRVEQLGISEQYFDYLYQVFGQTGSTEIFGNPPPARIRGNVFSTSDESKFVLGYFMVAAVASAETEVFE